jgi:hypothetical protein
MFLKNIFQIDEACEREPGFLALLKEVQPKADDQYELFDQKFDDSERELLQMKTSFDQLERTYNSMVELKHVLVKDARFLADQLGENAPAAAAPLSSSSSDVRAGRSKKDKKKDPIGDLPLLDNIVLGGDEPVDSNGQSAFVSIGLHKPAQAPADAHLSVAGTSFMLELGFISGVIPRDRLSTFERVLWRATRGNLFMRQVEIEEPVRDPTSGAMVRERQKERETEKDGERREWKWGERDSRQIDEEKKREGGEGGEINQKENLSLMVLSLGW